MGLDPLTVGLVMGGISAVSSFAGNQAKDAQMNAQRSAQAKQYERQAELTRMRGDQAARNISAKRSALTRQYQEAQAKNAVRLGVGNVDLSSGSALDVSQGNINAYASDIGDNAYERALKLWEADNQAKQYEASASYLSKTVNNTGSNLLTAGLSGLSGFAGGYTMAGGSLSNLLNPKGALVKETLWDKVYENGLSMRHPSGKMAFVPNSLLK